jgi:type II secretory pathway pseudopilin PulG
MTEELLFAVAVVIFGLLALLLVTGVLSAIAKAKENVNIEINLFNL